MKTQYPKTQILILSTRPWNQKLGERLNKRIKTEVISISKKETNAINAPLLLKSNKGK